MRDFQRSRLYSWEYEFIHRHMPDLVPFDQLQSLVDYIWREEGYKHPPRVSVIHKNNKRALAMADRLNIYVPEGGLQTTILIHEIAHSLTSEAQGGSCMHGPRYVGVYLKLLSKYAGFDLNELCMSAMKHKILYNFKGATI